MDMSDKSEENTHLSTSGSKGIVTKSQKIKRVPGTRRIRAAPGWSHVPEPAHCSRFRWLHLPDRRRLLPIYFRSLMRLEQYKKNKPLIELVLFKKTCSHQGWKCGRIHLAGNEKINTASNYASRQRLHAFSSAASAISHLAREQWLEQKTLEGHKESCAWGLRPFLKEPWNKSYY